MNASARLLRFGVPTVLLLACGFLNAADAPVVLKSEDGRFEMKLPAGWAATETKKPGVVIRAQSAAKDMLVSVSPDPKEDYENLQAYANKFLGPAPRRPARRSGRRTARACS